MKTSTSLCLFLAFFSCFLVSSSVAYNFYVGGNDGWVLNPSEPYDRWSGRLRFQVNDSLVFKFKEGSDSVLLVNKDDYNNCNTNNSLVKLTSGTSVFQFNRSGPFYFISGNKDNCQKGQKLIVVVLAIRNKSPPLPKTPPPVSQPPSSASPVPAISPVSPFPASPAPAISPVSPFPASSAPAISPASPFPSSPGPAISPVSPTPQSSSPSPSAITPELGPSPYGNQPSLAPSPGATPPTSAPSPSTAAPETSPVTSPPSSSPLPSTAPAPANATGSVPASPPAADVNAPAPPGSAASVITPSMALFLGVSLVMCGVMGV